MKKKQIYLFIISICLSTNVLISQTNINSSDSLLDKGKLLNINKLRLGFDLLKPIISSSEGDNLNYEIVGDLQLTDNIYLAGEYGLVDKLIEDENVNFNSNGNFLRFGFDYNMFKNWIGMDNSIYLGLRYATSKFSSKIIDYEVRNKDSYFSNVVTDEFQTIEYSNLSGNWIEILIGLKVETFENIYFGLSLRLNKLISDNKPDNFNNLYIPGFNKVTDENTFGSGFNYTLTYSIPLKKRK